jgi:hypothetical protein
MIKKILVLMLGVLILNSATELHQLLKLPLLIQHYIHHQSKDPSLSFLAFLKIHYTDPQHPNDNDDREDNELPFKSIGSISHLDTPIMEKRVVVDFNLFVPEKSTNYNREGIPKHMSFSVFHPPRIV